MTNLPNSVKNRTNILVVLGFLLLIFTVLSLILIRKYTITRYEILTSNISADGGIASIPIAKIETSQLEEGIFPDPVYETTSIHIVSTGRITDYKMKDNNSGEFIANANVLNAMTKDVNGKVKMIKIILQIFPVDSPDTNIYPTVAQIYNTIDPNYYSDSLTLTNIQLKEAFPEGSEWLLIPLKNLSSNFIAPEDIEIYGEYISRFYGDDFVQIEEYIESGLVNDYNKPIFVEGLTPL
jgi:hypothetical protein